MTHPPLQPASFQCWSRPSPQPEGNGQLPSPEIFKNIVKAPISFLVVRYNKLNHFLPKFQLVVAREPLVLVARSSGDFSGHSRLMSV